MTYFTILTRLCSKALFWSCSSCPLCNKVGQIIQGGEILSKKKGSFILLESEGNFITDWGSYTLKQRKYYAKSAWPFGKIKISQTNNLSEPITVSIRLQTPLECDMFVISLKLTWKSFTNKALRQLTSPLPATRYNQNW